MKSPKSSFTFSPFESLKDRFKSRPAPASQNPPPDPEETASHPERDEQVFRAAMEDVTPLRRDDRAVRSAGVQAADSSERAGEDEALTALRKLVTNGKGFVVADTPEYIEGAGYEGSLGLARRLHRGDFSIQAHLDLHGMNVEEARDALELFLKEAVTSGRRAVSVIHGRGLSSPAEPVLKNKVIEWLTSGPWRKWVLAFASAKACDGGAGATYLLLRGRPYKRRPGRKNPA
jgi:DNA-nicking Smr family endonuclease